MPSRSRLLALVLIALASSVRPVHAEELVELLNRARTKHDIPAMGALCLRGDVVQEWAVAGVRKRHEGGQVSPQDLWHLGSCTKAMTGTLVARLAERGTMRWDMTIVEVFPKIRDAVRPEYLTVTLEQLLTHRGGIPADVMKTKAWKQAWKQQGSLGEQRERFMLDVLALPPPVPVGTQL